MGKTVLNVSTFLNSDSTQDETIRELLVKLGCPQLNHTILVSSSSRTSNPTGATAVRKHYLAMVQSTEDVLGLLHQTLNSATKEEATLQNDEIERLLMFLQNGLSGLSRSLLVELPFYQTIIRTYSRISGSNTVYEVPDNVPVDDLQVLATVTNSIFLRHAPKLADLYRHIEIKKVSSVNFYLRTVLRYFNHLTPNGRVNHLKFVREDLLHDHCKGYEALLSAMKQLSFIPDHSGVLRQAEEFYDPANEVFEKFVPNEKFPPRPFDSMRWKEFLKKVGLQCSVTQDHFLQYAKQLEEEARNLPNPTSDDAEEILQKSSILVSHLFENESLHASAFLSRISKIKFVPAAKIMRLYLDIHPSYTNSIFTCFSGSVIEIHRALVWSSASILATSAVPYRRDDLINMLEIHTKPPHELVISHLKNISGRFLSTRNQEIPSTLQPILVDVMMKTYRYFKESCDSNSGPRPNCTRECKLTGNALRDVPVILVDGHTLVRGRQLAFSGVWNGMNPYMFNIPRELQHLEHFLKCLGAQERPTPLQCSSVLEAIKRSCGDNQMHAVEVRAAVEATKCLFIRLTRDKKRLQTRGDSALKVEQSLENVRNLYLPTEDNYLKPSCEVFVNDTMEKKERLKDYWKELLIDLTMRNHERPARLVELLPSHLKVQKLSSKLNEELSPSCIDKICILDQDPTEPSCDFIKRYRDIICSPEFSEALIRLYKCQEDTANVSEQVKNNLQSLENGVRVSCMQTVEVRLVTRETTEPVPGSESEVPSFCQKTPDGFCILIKHGEEGNPGVLHERLSSFISMITGQHINEAYWRYLMMILGVKDPREISKTLDDARLPRTINSNSKEPNPGDRIPENFHDLLKNNINYHLREGELVGYEKQEESEENDAVYVYAKIIEQTSQGDGRFAFNSRYKIDIGEEGPVEVSKLKLYKFDREGSVEAATSSRHHERMDLVPCEGPGTETDSSSEDATAREPATLEEAKREVAEALKEIWESLPESERSSAVKRLILRWHPDRNRSNRVRESFATEVTQFLFNEVERLNQSSRGPSRPTWDGPDFREFFRRDEERRRRRRHERRYEDQREPANRNEAERWMRQAQKDFNTASYLFRSEEEPYYSNTCFFCQQAVEKALKALMFAKGRLEMSDLDAHDVVGLAYRASRIDPRLHAIPDMVRVIHVRGYYIKTRYPYYTRGNLFNDSIPAEMFTRGDADEALSNAREILQLLRQVME